MPERILERARVKGGAALERTSRLSAGVLLLAARFANEEAVSTTLDSDGEERELGSLSITYDLPSRPGGGGQPCTLVMVFLPGGKTLRREDRFVLASGAGRIELSWHELKRATSDLKALARHAIAPLDADQRARVMKFLARALAVQPRRGAIRMSETLFELRLGLRDHLPVYDHAPDQPAGLAVESIMAVDNSSFYMEGWARDEEAEIVRVTAVSPEGDRAQIADKLYRFRRPDVTNFFSGGVASREDPDERAGFIAFFELDSPSLLSTGWVLEMENAEGTALETECPPVVRDSSVTRQRLLLDAARERLPDDDLMDNHVMPALMRLQHQVEQAAKVSSITDFGEVAEMPAVSIIVPLYKRVDLIEQQLAEFVLDPEMADFELIYVLDSPEQEDELLFLASRLFPVYRIPMRVAVLQQNVGFANANNAGASLARGRLLLLMNSDVLPDRPGWLGDMTRFYESTPNIGALAPKLLYEDGSIQNAGMHLHRPHGTSVWLDAHYFRGLHRNFPAANVARPVPLLSGACLMIGRALYEEMGGLRAIFVQGDYEDSDLCMRLNELGRDNWYFPQAEVFHLEAISYTPEMRMPANRYNGWLHTRLWKDRIEPLMARYNTPDGKDD